ncbi:hypothetical protein IQ06DRAFT_349024 [Phaeosphaeriaceae sp. SRC1lsM3a]|nr:hypothetical protein IQ06DRAFT_349024 [Stagonospora sp. SRC1lsM3a]
MGQIQVEIEINATPEEVRNIVLDFARYPEWHTSFIQSIATSPPNQNIRKLYQGQTLNVKVGGVKLVPVVKSNTPTELSWYGAAYGGAFSGTHYFKFLDSHITPNGTMFVHGEDYDGWMSWLFGDGMFGLGRSHALKMYKGFAEDVKKRMEERKKLRDGIAASQNDPWVKL